MSIIPPRQASWRKPLFRFNLGKKALVEENYQEAAKRLAVSFPGEPIGRNRYARQCLKANMELKNWQAALKESNDACYRQYGAGRPFQMRELAAHLSTRGTILDQLGKHKEAEQDRQCAAELTAKAEEVLRARRRD